MVAPSQPPPPVPGAAGTHPAESAADVVHAAEVLVERAVVAAERSLALRLGQRGLRLVLLALRALWTLAVLAFFVFGIAVLVTRYYLLPHIGDWRTRIEAAAGTALHAPVAIGHIEADWDGLNPRLLLQQVTLEDPHGGTALALPRVELVVSWTTLLAWQPRMHSLTIHAPELEVRRLADQRWTIAGLLLDLQTPPSDSHRVRLAYWRRNTSACEMRACTSSTWAVPGPTPARSPGGPARPMPLRRPPPPRAPPQTPAPRPAGAGSSSPMSISCLPAA